MNLILQKLGLTGVGPLTLALIFPALIIAFALGYILSFVYRRTHTGLSYEGSFNFTLVMVTIITTVIMMIIGSNIALSLGLIGSLSIIRFRAVIKDTKDMAYLFWAIATGLCVGSANYLMAFFSVPFIAAIVFYLTKVDFAKAKNTDYIMVTYCSVTPDSNSNSDGVDAILNSSKIKWDIRSSLFDRDKALKETTYSISVKKSLRGNLEDLLDKVNKLENVKKASLLHPGTNLFT